MGGGRLFKVGASAVKYGIHIPDPPDFLLIMIYLAVAQPVIGQITAKYLPIYTVVK